MKIGIILEVGDCFIGIVERNGMWLIFVVIKVKFYMVCFDEIKKLYDYGFVNFEVKNVYGKDLVIKGYEIVWVVNVKEKDVVV